jgi:dolichol-phosphate mannosyltransferase
MIGVVVPCYNEEETIDEFVKGFEKLKSLLEFEVIFVNDGSTDGTGKKLDNFRLKHPWINVLKHERNQGLAISLKDGFAYGLNEGFDLVAQMDSDLTHPPEFLLKMFNEIKNFDLVIASRYATGGGMVGVPKWRVGISQAGNVLFRLLLRIKTLDATSGFRMGRREVYSSLSLEADSFGIQLEMTVKAERKGLKIKEIPFILSNREKGTSKFKLRYLLGYIPLTLKLMAQRGG